MPTAMPTLFRRSFVCAAIAAALMPHAFAAGRVAPAEVQARYDTERAACNAKPSPDDRTACLRDAVAAKEAALRGELELPAIGYDRNREARCDALPEADRDACRRRAREEGATTGSVGAGGILREYRELTLTPPPDDSGAPGGSSGNASGSATEQPLTR